MVLDQIIFGTALLGSLGAAAYDLKTTEVPNWVFYAMMVVGIPAVILKSILGGSFSTFAISGITGLGLLGFGYMMYRLGQWGGADMVLLALIGFMMASASLGFAASLAFPFGLSFLFNVFIVGAVYMIIYAITFAARNPDVASKFKHGVKASSKLLAVISVSMAALFTAVMLYINSLLGNSLTLIDMLRGVAVPLALTVSFLLVYRFAKAVENFGFKKKIPVSQLKVGDMLLQERKLVGITQQQLGKIKKSGKRFVWIKEGVRFAPAFPIALLFTLFVGDAIMLVRLFF